MAFIYPGIDLDGKKEIKIHTCFFCNCEFDIDELTLILGSLSCKRCKIKGEKKIGKTITKDNSNYLFSKGTITGYTGKETHLKIPAQINGIKMEIIGFRSFDHSDLENVDIPEGVTNIGGYAFTYNLLKKIVIPDSVTSIGYGAFAYNKLEIIEISGDDPYRFNDRWEDIGFAMHLKRENKGEKVMGKTIEEIQNPNAFEKTTKEIVEFRESRGWIKTPIKDLGIALGVEHSEFMRNYIWSNFPPNEGNLKDELADIFIYSFAIANELNLNVEEIIKDKIEKNKQKYPETFFNCDHCNKQEETAEMKKTCDGELCRSCGQRYYKCERCDVLTNEKDLYLNESKWICEPCFKSKPLSKQNKYSFDKVYFEEEDEPIKIIPPLTKDEEMKMHNGTPTNMATDRKHFI